MFFYDSLTGIKMFNRLDWVLFLENAMKSFGFMADNFWL